MFVWAGSWIFLHLGSTCSCLCMQMQWDSHVDILQLSTDQPDRIHSKREEAADCMQMQKELTEKIIK